MPKVHPDVESFARIKVVGVGGSGKNALNHMINSKVKGVEFICMNTDTQDLHHSLAEKKIHIGRNLTKGLGSGMNPEVGKQSANETKAEIQEALKGADMVFIAGGMGGGTGSGAAPVVASIAKEQDILTVAVVTKPFTFEGQQRMKIAEQGVDELRKEVDAIIIISNDRLLDITDRETSFKDAFATCDEVLRQAVESISELITTPGTINIDFADIKTILTDAGSAFMGIGMASGETRAQDAAHKAINSPLLDMAISGAKGVLFSISGADDLKMHEVQDAAKIITESIDPQARVIFGTIHDDTLPKGTIKVTVIATGFTGVSDNRRSAFGSSARGAAQPTQPSPLAARKQAPVIEQEPISELPQSSFGTQETTELKHVEEINDEDDWSAVPAFLRRNTKK